MKKHHWHVFWHEKLFEKHPQPHCEKSSNKHQISSAAVDWDTDKQWSGPDR
jgi:hypothetical protein